MKKILSIDGGGIKGVFPSSFLSSIEDACGCRIADYFDLIVGTSTGGIIALALGLGLTSKEILSFYENYGPTIFAGNRLFKWIKQWGFSKYDNTALRTALQETFKDRRLGDSGCRLAIPSMNLETGEVHIFKTSHHKKFGFDYQRTAVDVALATTSAPTYFPTHRGSEGVPLLDGGLWANNPIGLAVVEAIGILKWEAAELRILSLGCTSEPLKVGWGKVFGLGKSYWATKLVDVFMTSQSSASLGTANVLTSEDHSAVFRYDPVVAAGKFSLDSIKQIGLLKGLGHSEARKAFPHIQFFFNERAEPFTPFQSYKL